MKLIELLVDVANAMNIKWAECTDGDWSLHNGNGPEFDDDNRAISIDQVVIVECKTAQKTFNGHVMVDALAVFTVDCWEEYGAPRYDFELQTITRRYTEALGEAARINTVFHASQIWTHNDQEEV